MTPTTILQAPKLTIDGDRTPHAQGIIERRIVWNLVAKLKAAGFTAVAVYDGEEYTKTPDAQAAMELIFNLDEASLRLIRSTNTEAYAADPDSVNEHGILLVLGNGEDIISDWNYSADDTDGFNAAMDKIVMEQNF